MLRTFVVLNTALTYVFATAAIWVVLFQIATIQQPPNVWPYMRNMVVLAAVLPMLTAGIASRMWFHQARRAMTPGETWLHALVAFALLVFGAATWEAAIMRSLPIGTEQLPGLMEMVFLPWGARYSMSSFFGQSFLTVAAVALGIATLVFIPFRTKGLERRFAKPTTSEAGKERDGTTQSDPGAGRDV
jgi:hypothetical protein